MAIDHAHRAVGEDRDLDRVAVAGEGLIDGVVDDLVDEVVQAAHAESTRLIDTAHAEADRLRGECDIYVDNKLAEFEEFLNGTLRSVGRGRHQLRTAAGTHDYVTR